MLLSFLVSINADMAVDLDMMMRWTDGQTDGFSASYIRKVVNLTQGITDLFLQHM